MICRYTLSVKGAGIAFVMMLASVVSSSFAQWEHVRFGVPEPTITALGFNRYSDAFGVTGSSLFALDTTGAPSRLICDTCGGVEFALLRIGTLLLAGTDGVLRSVDDGATWTRASRQPIVDLATAPDGTVYGRHLSWLLRSTDEGASWDTLRFDLARANSYLAVRSNGEFFVATFPALFRSTDRGESFTRITTVPDVWCVYSTPGGAMLIWHGGYLRSEDLVTWDTVFMGDGCDLVSGPGTDLWSVISDSDSLTTDGLYGSFDDGRTWRWRSSVGPATMSVDGKNRLWRAQTNATLVSDPGAFSWRHVGFSREAYAGAVSSLAIHDRTLFAGVLHRGGVGLSLYRSGDDGVTWTEILDSATTVPFTDVDGLLVAARLRSDGGADVLASTDAGQRWSTTGLRGSLLGASRAWDTAGRPIALVYTREGIAVGRRGADWEWSAVATALPRNLAMALAPDGTLVRGAYNDNVLLRSTDAGATWSILLDSVSTWSLSITSDASILLGCYPGVGSSYRGLHRGTRLGAQWTQVLPASHGSTGQVRRGGPLFLLSTPSLRSVDDGATWDTVGVTGVTRLMVHPRPGLNADLLSLAATASSAHRIVRSVDDGRTWHVIGDERPIPDTVLTGAVISPSGSLFAATGSSGLFRFRSFASSPISASTAPAPGALRQVLPNPARTNLTVSLELTAPTVVDLELDDLLGHCVRRSSAACGSGRTTLQIDLDGVQPGGYALTVTTDRTRDGAMIIVER